LLPLTPVLFCEQTAVDVELPGGGQQRYPSLSVGIWVHTRLLPQSSALGLQGPPSLCWEHAPAEAEPAIASTAKTTKETEEER
jgi:hypothetical protein